MKNPLSSLRSGPSVLNVDGSPYGFMGFGLGLSGIKGLCSALIRRIHIGWFLNGLMTLQLN